MYEIEDFLKSFDFDKFIRFCQNLNSNTSKLSNSDNFILSKLREIAFAHCLLDNKFLLSYIDQDGKDYVVVPNYGESKSFYLELKTSKKMVNKGGTLGSGKKIKMFNYRGNLSFNTFMDKIDQKMRSDLYIFVDTTNAVVFYAKKDDMLSDAKNWIPDGDGVWYILKDDNPIIGKLNFFSEPLKMISYYDQFMVVMEEFVKEKIKEL